MQQRLRITEIFFSIQGESLSAGLPTVFVRLTGCPLRCRYCDTTYAFSGGRQRTIAEILEEVATFDPVYVTVTGGEPLAQAHCHTLLTALCDAGYRVSLETSGALSVAEVDPRVVRVVDIKTPGSGEDQRNLPENIPVLTARDQVKFVILDRHDYDWSKAFIEAHLRRVGCELLFSPVHGALAPVVLAEWILADRLPVRLQLQLHKYLWGDEPGH